MCTRSCGRGFQCFAACPRGVAECFCGFIEERIGRCQMWSLLFQIRLEHGHVKFTKILRVPEFAACPRACGCKLLWIS
jgi:hypothetical protein